MRRKKQSSVVLVYDRYYGKKPSAVLQSLKKTLFCAALSVCAVLFLTVEYKMQVNLLAAAGITALCCAIFCTIFCFFKKRVAIPIILFFGAVVVFFNRESLIKRLSYFTDSFLLRLDGDVFYTQNLTFHTSAQLAAENPPCADGTALGIALLGAVFALLTAACMFKRPVIYPSLFAFISACAPIAIACNLTFNFMIIPTIALYVGAVSVSKAYSDGAAINKGFFGSFHADALREEREFRNKTAKNSFVKRTQMNGIYYSKYAATACWAAAVFASAALIANSFAPVKNGFDFSSIYNFISNLGQNTGITSPFESGPVSEYFAEYGSGGNSSLNIISPGNGEQEILSVSSPAGEIYLRGDIGIDYTGASWTSPIRSEPELWKKSSLSEVFRPAEMRILQMMELDYITDSINSGDETAKVSGAIRESEVVVDYRCPTNVVFLPAYTSEFGFFEDEMFDVYGDYSVRVNGSYDRINTVICSALVPPVNYTGTSRESKLEYFDYLEKVSEKYPMDGIFDAYFNAAGLYSDYRSYVKNTYLTVPGNIKPDIKKFLLVNNLNFSVTKDGKIDSKSAYEAAVKITDFLIKNYTYSLDAKYSKSNPVKSFLYETKSGHCALFASSMTLMLRELGIPARYCTGFVAPKTNAGQYAVLRSKNLHAWCEAYFEGIGWVTFDPTSGTAANAVVIDESGDNSSDSESSESSESSEQSSNSSESSSSESSESSENEQSGSVSRADLSGDERNPSAAPENPEPPPTNALPMIITIICIVAAIGLAAFVLTRLKKLDKTAKKALKKLYSSTDSEFIYEKLLRILKMCGLSPEAGELPEKFYERCEKKLFVPLSAHSEVLLKTAFGSESGEAETAELARVLESVFYAADKVLKPVRRLTLRKAVITEK